MRFLLAVCAIGIFVSWVGLFEQMGRYFQAGAAGEIASGLQIAIEEPTERRLRDFIPDEKAATFAKNILAHNREISQQMVGNVRKIAADLESRSLWDAGLWGIQMVVLSIVFGRLNAVRRGKRELSA